MKTTNNSRVHIAHVAEELAIQIREGFNNHPRGVIIEGFAEKGNVGVYHSDDFRIYHSDSRWEIMIPTIEWYPWYGRFISYTKGGKILSPSEKGKLYLSIVKSLKRLQRIDNVRMGNWRIEGEKLGFSFEAFSLLISRHGGSSGVVVAARLKFPGINEVSTDYRSLSDEDELFLIAEELVDRMEDKLRGAAEELLSQDEEEKKK